MPGMPHLSLRTKIFLAFVLLVGGGYLVSRLGLSSEGVPGEFSDARLQGALIAQDIMNISNQMSADLNKARTERSNSALRFRDAAYSSFSRISERTIC